MATLHDETLKKRRRKKLYAYAVLLIAVLLLSPVVAEAIDGALRGIFLDFGNFQFDFNYKNCVMLLLEQRVRKFILLGFLLISMCFYMLTTTMTAPPITSTSTVEVATGISIPVPVGNGQYGNARFMKAEELNQVYDVVQYNGNGKIEHLRNNTGIIVSFEKRGKSEYIRYLGTPVHVIILGSTRIGKTRRLLLTSTWLDIMAGVNMCITDVKGEIYAYTSEFAKNHGYRVLTFDIREPEKSDHHNYMIDVIKNLEIGDIPTAVDKAWDLVSVLVGEAKGEKIWNNGECSTIAAAILIVAQDAPTHCKNITNVYYFLAYMCEMDEYGEMPINRYLEEMPENHPARAAFQVAKIAPSRTRSSFFTSALATLRHFTNYKISEMTSMSDYTMEEFDEQKTILYLIVPDERKNLYSLGSLYIKQLYESLVAVATKKGGRLNNRFIFRCDEVGNFPVIPDLGTMMSAAAGRNIFFELVLQDYQQLESKYKEDYGNIKGNAQLTMYLRTTEEKTLETLSKRCDTYTVQINSTSSSQSDGKNNKLNYSSSANMASRPLLYPGEIGKIKSPDVLLLMGGEHPAITQLPDLTQYYANKEFGLGDEAYNQKVYLQRHGAREARPIQEPLSWGIWNKYKGIEPQTDETENVKKVSFLN